MLKALTSLFSPPLFQAESHAAYVSLVAQARKSFFYSEYQVADTIDGRFDVIVMHMFLISQRLKAENSEDAGEFNRALQEVFFADMDRSLREMGSTDTGVGKRIKKMAQAFYGRMQAYSKVGNNPALLKEALARNLYRENVPSEETLGEVTGYFLRNMELLASQPLAEILAGNPKFSD